VPTDNRVTELRLKHAFTLLTAENLIDVRICDIAYPELSLAKVAQSLSISARYLQRLLESSGTSFTAHDCRLAFPIFRTSTGFSVRALAIRQKASAHIPVWVARRAVFSESTHPSAPR
jgi:hypothetical protein